MKARSWKSFKTFRTKCPTLHLLATERKKTGKLNNNKCLTKVKKIKKLDAMKGTAMKII